MESRKASETLKVWSHRPSDKLWDLYQSSNYFYYFFSNIILIWKKIIFWWKSVSTKKTWQKSGKTWKTVADNKSKFSENLFWCQNIIWEVKGSMLSSIPWWNPYRMLPYQGYNQWIRNRKKSGSKLSTYAPKWARWGGRLVGWKKYFRFRSGLYHFNTVCFFSSIPLNL